jgi:hypothetical protein
MKAFGKNTNNVQKSHEKIRNSLKFTASNSGCAAFTAGALFTTGAGRLLPPFGAEGAPFNNVP